ncbi:alpha/beta fold hydrolase [Kribbella sp. VKM Ac-2568]|uniref:alpha/beta fold hydrolase n=1 Tax=Kribbella sp. VKM Ac-2568 TaxID=2512219 RepID=UPI00104823E5|nr:alpha/beta hydrolase [Kribbella sp. VKM Ac-2568]TCM44296.1 pimeloyl-ACP methyl ester carboxylesterase [Kribbella sp. VKM Ac-2568]
MDPAFRAAYAELLHHWTLPVESLTLESEFGSTHVNACGPPDAPPLVLLAGHGATSAVWFGLANHLGQNHRIYAIDLIIDAGLSVNSGRKITKPEDLHQWLTAVLDGLQLPRTHLCGHSYGSWLALSYALHAPDRVDKLALIDPTDCFTPLRTSYVLRALPSLLKPTRARTKSFLLWETQGVPINPAWLELAGLAAEFPKPRPVRPKRPTDEALRTLHPDLLVVIADHSKSQNPARLATRVQTLIPTATIAHLPTTHHSLPAAQTEELAAALEKHLS